MARYQVILSYDGTQYRGFQRLRAEESGAERSIQGTVEAALRTLDWRGRTLLAAGRTDAGVHAQGQVIAFDLEWRHTERKLRNALNARLPKDISAEEVRETSDDFHPRFSAKARWYTYRLFEGEVRRPIEERFAWRIWPPISGGWAGEAAGYLVGRHDFRAFGKSPRPGGNTIRTVYQSEWRQCQGFWVYDIVANSFLLHMVRRIVKLLVTIGQGWMSPQIVLDYLRGDRMDEDAQESGEGMNGEKQQSGGVQSIGLAPPHGLNLLKVFYIPFEESGKTLDCR